MTDQEEQKTVEVEIPSQRVEEELRERLGLSWFEDPPESFRTALLAICRNERRPAPRDLLEYNGAGEGNPVPGHVVSVGPHPQGDGVWVCAYKDHEGVIVYATLDLHMLAPGR